MNQLLLDCAYCKAPLDALSSVLGALDDGTLVHIECVAFEQEERRIYRRGVLRAALAIVLAFALVAAMALHFAEGERLIALDPEGGVWLLATGLLAGLFALVSRAQRALHAAQRSEWHRLERRLFAFKASPREKARPS